MSDSFPSFPKATSLPTHEHHPTCALTTFFDQSKLPPSFFHSLPQLIKVMEFCHRFPKVMLSVLAYFQNQPLQKQHQFIIQLNSHAYHCFSATSSIVVQPAMVTNIQGSVDPRIKRTLLRPTELRTLPPKTTSLQNNNLDTDIHMLSEEMDEDFHMLDISDVPTQHEKVIASTVASKNDTNLKKRKALPPLSNANGIKNDESNIKTFNPTSTLQQGPVLLDLATFPKDILYRIFHKLRFTPSTLLALHCLNKHWLLTMTRYFQQYPLLYAKFQPCVPSSISSTSLPSPPLLHEDTETVLQSYLYSFRDPLLHPYHPQSSSLYIQNASRPMYRCTFMADQYPFSPHATFLPLTLTSSWFSWLISLPWLTSLDLFDPSGDSFPYDIMNLAIQSLASKLVHLRVEGPFTLAGDFTNLTHLHGSHGVTLAFSRFPRLRHLVVRHWKLEDPTSFALLLTSPTIHTWTVDMADVPDEHFPLALDLPMLHTLHISRRWLTDVFAPSAFPRLRHVHVLGCPDDVAKHASRFLQLQLSYLTHLTLSNQFEIDHHVCKVLFRDTRESPSRNLRSLTLRDVLVTPRVMHEGRFHLPRLTTCELNGEAAWLFFQTFQAPKLRSITLRQLPPSTQLRLKRYLRLERLHLHHIHALDIRELAELAPYLRGLSLISVSLTGNVHVPVRFPLLSSFHIRPWIDGCELWQCPQLPRRALLPAVESETIDID